MQNDQEIFSRDRFNINDSVRTWLRGRPITQLQTILLVYSGLLLLIAVSVWGSLSWIDTNVTPLGRDAGGHLTRSLQFADVLTQVTPQTLFEALSYHDYRPPLMYMAVQPFYRLFGYNMNTAASLNVLLLAGTLALTFILARRITTKEWAAVLAVGITAFWPMVAAMSRLFYLEMFQTFFVLLILWALLASDGFVERRWALVWGGSLGLGLLVKWMIPVYVALPVLITIWQSGVLREQWKVLRRRSVSWHSLAIAVIGAGILATLLYWPNRARIQEFVLGAALWPLWLLLLTPALYALRRPSTRLTNLWAGTCIALSLASLWYATRIEFAAELLEAAFGSYKGNYGPFNPWRLSNYTRYVEYFSIRHAGPLMTALLVPMALLGWLRRSSGWRNARPGAWILWGSLVSTYVILSLASQDGERNIVPIIPIVAILCADALREYPRRIATIIAVTWLVVLGAQWSLFTFDRLGPFYNRTQALWARVEFLQRPADGITDPGFWIAPDVLGRVQASHEPRHGPKVIFGMLINSIEIHRGPYHYLIGTEYPDVDLFSLTEDGRGGWASTVRSEWVLTKDGDNHDVDPDGLRALAEVYQNPDGLFPLLFERVTDYPLPNGETATLWRRTVGARYLPESPESLEPLAETLERWLDDQPLLLTTRNQALWLGLLDLTPASVQIVDGARPDAPTVFLLRHRGRPGDEATLAWLHETYYTGFGSWFDSEYLEILGRPTREMQTLPGSYTFDGDTLRSTTTQTEIDAGNVLPIELQWTDTDRPLKASLRLLDPNDDVVMQFDRDVKSRMRLGLFVPPETPANTYTLGISVYDPDTLEPVPAESGAVVVKLGDIRVSER